MGCHIIVSRDVAFDKNCFDFASLFKGPSDSSSREPGKGFSLLSLLWNCPAPAADGMTDDSSAPTDPQLIAKCPEKNRDETLEATVQVEPPQQEMVQEHSEKIFIHHE